MTEQQEALVDNIFGSWNRGETSSKLATQQLTRIVKATDDKELLRLAKASLEVIEKHS